MITCNSYFSGGGVFDAGLIAGGLTIKQSYELDKYAARVQRNNLGDHVNECDLRTKLVADDRADVMAFTYPCTKYSSIADISGTRTGDDLYLHAFRHMAIASPDIFIVENVMGMKKFPLVMEAHDSNLPGLFL
jgi:Site-specific DNA methylase